MTSTPQGVTLAADLVLVTSPATSGAVSALKAAMMRFGQKPADIFSEVRAEGDGYRVVMRDHGVPINGRIVGHPLAVINGREEVWGRQGGYPPTKGYANALALV
ncbi:hypothetical protein [Pseudomonas sp. MH9.3]|uniref:hypothetical protein n=1 Tax=Pseudomonas sp. MH9.3 TaxID=3048630 RepID=UPI002AC9C89C|nr:hypothetical protein [Pseudomonas sp. MH9.3]MEB0108180.1 hypothetical protein [Pseudomonas sp. MH9.3]WPX80733.1 hypothetical protein RHM60_06370 [Pseudomonas sp. MH9.3]WQG57414.1 hypothetical protein RHM66_20430 [Pseudomonas sp. RTB3]